METTIAPPRSAFSAQRPAETRRLRATRSETGEGVLPEIFKIKRTRFTAGSEGVRRTMFLNVLNEISFLEALTMFKLNAVSEASAGSGPPGERGQGRIVSMREELSESNAMTTLNLDNCAANNLAD